MTQQNLKVGISYGELKAEFEGSPSEVYEQVLKFLEKTIPAYGLASRISRSVGVSDVMERMRDLIAYSEGEGLYLTKPLHSFSTSDAILLILTVTHLESALGLREGDSATASEIASKLGRPMKTVSGRLSELVRRGYVRRLGRGGYSLSRLGLAYVVEAYSTVRG